MDDYEGRGMEAAFPLDGQDIALELEVLAASDAGSGSEDGRFNDQEEEGKADGEGWYEWPLHKRWEDTVNRLICRDVCWDDAPGGDEEEEGDASIRVLDSREKKSLAESNPKDKTSPTVLHRLAVDFNCENFKQLTAATQLKVITYLLQARKGGPLNNAGTAEDPILTRAMEHENMEFITFIVEHCASSLPDLLEARDVGRQNCLHYIFKVQLPDALYRKKDKGLRSRNTLKILGSIFKYISPQCLTAKDSEGNTPMHYALGYKTCRMPIEMYPNMVLHLMRVGDKALRSSEQRSVQFNIRGESPYLYFLRTRREYMLKQEAAQVSARPVEKEIKHGAHGSKDTHHRDATKDLPMPAKRQTDRNAPVGFNLARSNTAGLVERHPPESAPLLERDLDSSQPGDAAGETRAKQVALSRPGEEPQRFHLAAEKVRNLLKAYYIRSRPDVEAKELLYGRVASDKNLYFDATHMKGKSPQDVADLIQMLNKPGGFEDTLSYVSLPVLGYTTEGSYGANDRRQRDAVGQDGQMTGRNSAVAVFDKLAEVGVRNVLQLIVEEDPKSPHHTDAAIERAISGGDSFLPDDKRQQPGFAVETWNWKKLDLSTDVIRLSSPKVSEVNLYWSGNQTVLRGWASDEGILRLYQDSGKKLKSIIIHWSPGSENVRRCESLLSDFKKQVETRIADNFKTTQAAVNVQLRRLRSNEAGLSDRDSQFSPLTPGNFRVPRHHDWIESMQNFRAAMISVHNGLQKEVQPDRIKVALIDDGIDRTRLNMYGHAEVTGMSYWTTSGGMAPQNPSWHQSTHGHGTIMANSIVRVNPWVKLYAMRIQDESVDAGSRQGEGIRIYAGSAARAIEDATIAKVDIISMSWTIASLASQDAKGFRSYGGDAISALQKAIDKAKDNKILLFCSASDDLQKKGADTLPYSQARGYAFRIGAADAFGWSDKATEDQRNIDWFFPGNKVVDDFNPRTTQPADLRYRDGSSVATALAAGLASLILYLANVLKTHYRTDPGRATKVAEYGADLRRRDGLNKAFEKIITDENYRDKKFLPVWDLFGTTATKISATKDAAAKWELLYELFRDIAP